MIELVGILNLTPDSFSDGNQHNTLKDALKHSQAMLDNGASIIDVGAESTRPGAQPISWAEEISRLTKFITEIKTYSWPISIDTYHPETVKWLKQHLSEFIINDVTGFRNPVMCKMAAELNCKIILSHLPKISHSIQDAHHHKPINSINQVIDELHDSIAQLIKTGIHRQNIIIDPGIGFGKTKELNWQLLKFGKHMPEYKVMIGYSRKRFLGQNRMEIMPNYKAGQIAANHNAKYLRVHDIVGHTPLMNKSTPLNSASY